MHDERSSHSQYAIKDSIQQHLFPTPYVCIQTDVKMSKVQAELSFNLFHSPRYVFKTFTWLLVFWKPFFGAKVFILREIFPLPPSHIYNSLVHCLSSLPVCHFSYHHTKGERERGHQFIFRYVWHCKQKELQDYVLLHSAHDVVDDEKGKLEGVENKNWGEASWRWMVSNKWEKLEVLAFSW